MDCWRLTADIESWKVKAKMSPMACCQRNAAVVSGYPGQIRDLVVDWAEVARILDADAMTSLVWDRAASDTVGNALLGTSAIDGLESTVRVTVGTIRTHIEGVATFRGGQTARMCVIVCVDNR